jgi:hypothetical protein
MARRGDSRTLDLFEVPRAPEPAAGSLDIDSELRATLSAMLKAAPLSREVVAGKMSELIGRHVSISMLNAYTAESRERHNFPFQYAAALESVCESYALSELLARKRGCKVLVGEDALLAELGKLERQEQEVRARKAALKDVLRRRR